MSDQNNDFQTQETPAPRGKVVCYLLMLVIMGLAVNFLLPQIASLEHSYQVIKEMQVWAVILAMSAQFGFYYGSGYLLKSLARHSEGNPSIIQGAMITIAAVSFGMVAGGMLASGAVIYRWMRNEKVGREASTLAAIIPALFIDIVLVIISSFGLIYLLLTHKITNFLLISFIIILIVLLGIIVSIVWRLEKGIPFLGLLRE